MQYMSETAERERRRERERVREISPVASNLD